MMAYVEWLFSGVGTSILVGVVSVWFVWIKGSRKKTLMQGEKATERDIDISEAKSVKKTLPVLSETEKIAMRFAEVLELMNSGRSHNLYRIAELARKMGLRGVEELEKIFLGEQEASFKIMKSFCNHFGVSFEWLAEGKNHPFVGKRPPELMPIEALERILSSNPEEICFVRSRSKSGRSTILLKHDLYKYGRATRAWNISSEIGGTGERQLVSFYKLVCKLRGSGKFNLRGKMVDESVFNDLMSGEMYFGQFFYSSVDDSEWWDDLTDYNHKYAISGSYENCHGEEFVKAQVRLRSVLGEIVL